MSNINVKVRIFQMNNNVVQNEHDEGEEWWVGEG
jgi:hypothetical protein